MQDDEQIVTSLLPLMCSRWVSANGQPLSVMSWRLTVVLRILVAWVSSSVFLSCERCTSCSMNADEV